MKTHAEKLGQDFMGDIPRHWTRIAAANRWAASLAWAVWWGGLTFYAAIVVPIGSSLFGSLRQGLVTQRVSWWLNGLAFLALIASLPQLRKAWNRPLGLAWWIVLFTSLLLSWWHFRLDLLIDSVAHVVVDRGEFYVRHRIYLWLTALQWLAGLFCVVGFGEANLPTTLRKPEHSKS